MSDRAIPLSVVVPATHASTTLAALVDRLQPELSAMGGELLIMDGSAQGLDGMPVTAHLAGADVFALRAAGAEQARGELVAFTEDHCLPGSGWCQVLVDALARNPAAAAVTGSVTNGSTDGAMSWANFLIVFAPFLPPIASRSRTRVPGPANVAVRGDVLRAHEMTPGLLEFELIPHLQTVGRLAFDPAPIVQHFQPRGLDAISIHFHNGRSTAGLPRRRPPRREIAIRLMRCALLPWRLAGDVLTEVQRRRSHRRIAVRTLPLVLLLGGAHAAGEAIGVLFGPGGSPQALE